MKEAAITMLGLCVWLIQAHRREILDALRMFWVPGRPVAYVGHRRYGRTARHRFNPHLSRHGYVNAHMRVVWA